MKRICITRMPLENNHILPQHDRNSTAADHQVGGWFDLFGKLGVVWQTIDIYFP